MRADISGSAHRQRWEWRNASQDFTDWPFPIQERIEEFINKVGTTGQVELVRICVEFGSPIIGNILFSVDGLMLEETYSFQ